MIIKIIGSLIVVVSMALLGMHFGNLEAYRIGDLQELKKALAVLKAEIEFLLTPLPEALKHVSERTKSPISILFAEMSDELANRTQENTGVLWVEKLTAHEKDLFLSRDDIEQISSFGRTLGYLDLNMQLSSIYMLTQYIDATIESLQEIRDKNRKTYRSLGILGGLIVVVVFI